MNMRRLAALFLAVFVIGAGFTLQNATAQTAGGPQLLITWRSTAYVPPGYRGHTLPTSQSNIVASVQVVDNGTIVDMAGQTIYWYLDDEFIESGRNKPTVEFQTSKNDINVKLDLMVRVPDYKGGLVNTIEIPVVSPRAVIDAPFGGGFMPSDTFTLRALPYFFNAPRASRLAMTWTVNGVDAPAENPSQLTLNPVELPLPTSVGLSINNPFSALGFEVASAVLDLR